MLGWLNDDSRKDRFVAIRPGGRDDASDTHVAWLGSRGLPEMPSPLFYRGRVGYVRDGGMWTVLDPKSGKAIIDRERIGVTGQYVASPVAANGFIYLVSEPGTVTVLRAGDTLEIAASNRIGEGVRTTPAPVGSKLYIRGREHLWAFGAPADSPTP